MELALEDAAGYQFLARAKAYLAAVKIVVDQEGSKRLFRAPVLHLIAHGLEVLFKHVLLKEGKTEEDIRKEYGHNLEKLWNYKDLRDLRNEAYITASHAWKVARDRGKYCGNFQEKACDVLDINISSLSHLHTTSSNYALRYSASRGERAPIPLLLIDTFLPVTDEFMRRLGRGQ